MKGEISAETPLGFPASRVWECFRGHELGHMIDTMLGDVIGKGELVEGDGGVGTVIKVTFPSGTPGLGYMKEKFIKIDDETRVREVEVIEGGDKEFGFDYVRIKFEVIEKEKDAKSCIVKNTLFYEIEDSKYEAASAHISTKPHELIAETVGIYLLQKQYKDSTTTKTGGANGIYDQVPIY